ncbi:PREDICTED: cytochrome P450 76C4-like [Camelina sativa]|uniref:Cytochrome P450 76C4-like n=1 Tax=Camelina sativa TaxID=90675 RepID=A0ABM0X0F1_CAMSA|nr:PREDICTED: cytochrome P450 76C4-like [Camelina sativa]
MDIISGQSMFLLFCFILSCFLFFTTARSRRSSSQLSISPPGPPRLPIIGNIHLVGKNPHHSFTNLSKTYGPVMSLKLGCLNSVVIASRDAAREVLRTHDLILSGRYINEAIRSNNHHELSVGWVHPSSPRFRMLRRLLVTQLFSPQRIEATKALRMKKVQELINFISESSEREEPLDICRASFITSLNIISNILFSVNLGSYDSKDPSAFQEMVTGYMESNGNPDLANFFPFMRFLDLQGNSKKMKRNSESLFKVFRGFYDARVVENSSRTEEKDVSSRDFLDALIDLQQGDQSEINIDEIEHLLLDLFVAGTDTNSSTVEWAMAELLRNPKTMTKVQDEINHVIGQNEDFQESDISKLPYLQAVIKETFRLHPAAPFLLPRKAETDVEILGFPVLKESQVLVNVWAIGRDPKLWENPTQFEPERFLGKEIDVKGTDYDLTPFGAGRRICPGLPLALKIVPLMLASLLCAFEWKLPNGVSSADLDMEETFGLTVHKTNPLLAVPLKKRAKN